jgi:hypothetical protein
MGGIVAAKLRRRGAARARLVVLGCIAPMFAVAALGTVLITSPADATPLASASVIVNRPPVDSLLSLCITSHSLNPSGTCVGLPPTSLGTAPGQTRGTYTGFGECDVGECVAHYDLVGQFYVGSTAVNTTAVLSYRGSDTASSYTAQLTSSRMTGTCTVRWLSLATPVATVGLGVLVADCEVSVDAGPATPLSFRMHSTVPPPDSCFWAVGAILTGSCTSGVDQGVFVG